MNENSKRLAHFAMLFKTLLVGVGYTICSWAAREIPPFQLQFLRITSSALMFLMLFPFLGSIRGFQPTKKEWGLLIALAIMGTVVNQLLFVFGLKYTTPANSALIYSVTPVIVLAISIYFLKREVMRVNKAIGAVLALAGVLVVILSGSSNTTAPNPPLGNTFTFVALFCWSFYLIFTRTLTTRYPPLQVTGAIMIVGAILYLPFGAYVTYGIDLTTISAKAWLGLFWLAAVNSTLSYIVISYALRHLQSSQVAIYINAQPLVAASFSVAMGYDEISLPLIIGCMLTVGGIFLINRTQ